MANLVCNYLSQDMTWSDMIPLGEVIDRCIENIEPARIGALFARDGESQQIVGNYTFPLGKDSYPELRAFLFTAAFLMVWAIGPYRFHSRLCEYLSCHCLCLDEHR